jgi:hypothetical protein
MGRKIKTLAGIFLIAFGLPARELFESVVKKYQSVLPFPKI